MYLQMCGRGPRQPLVCPSEEGRVPGTTSGPLTMSTLLPPPVIHCPLPPHHQAEGVVGGGGCGPVEVVVEVAVLVCVSVCVSVCVCV